MCSRLAAPMLEQAPILPLGRIYIQYIQYTSFYIFCSASPCLIFTHLCVGRTSALCQMPGPQCCAPVPTHPTPQIFPSVWECTQSQAPAFVLCAVRGLVLLWDFSGVTSAFRTHSVLWKGALQLSSPL